MAISKRSNGRGIKRFICLAGILLPAANPLLAHKVGSGLPEWQADAHRTSLRERFGRVGNVGRCRATRRNRSEEHTSELQSLRHLVCRLLLEKKNHVISG